MNVIEAYHVTRWSISGFRFCASAYYYLSFKTTLSGFLMPDLSSQFLRAIAYRISVKVFQMQRQVCIVSNG